MPLEPADNLISLISRAVGRDDDFQPVLRVIERESVFQLGLDVALFVICGDDYRDARRDVGAPDRTPENTADREDQNRIADVYEGYQRHCGDEDNLGDEGLVKPGLSEHIISPLLFTSPS